MLVGEFFKEVKFFVEDGVQNLEEKKELLANCSATTLIGEENEFFAKMVMDVVIAIGDDDRLNLIGIYKVKSWLDLYEEDLYENNFFSFIVCIYEDLYVDKSSLLGFYFLLLCAILPENLW